LFRFDFGEITSLRLTDEGFLRGYARVTRTGVYNYRNPDGTSRRELRHPDDVFNLDSLNTLKMIPITEGHPAISKLVTAETAKSVTIGYTGESFRPDGKFVIMPIVITDKAGVEAVNNGKDELSLGYEVELDEELGNYDGMEYDFRQRNIKYNHLAIVKRGRAGPDVRLNTDEAEEIRENIQPNQPSQQRSKNMAKLRLDTGCEYEVPQEVIAAFDTAKKNSDTLQTNLDQANTDAEKLRADADTAKESAKKLQERIDGLSQEITKAVAARIELERTANGLLSKEVKVDGMTDDEIRKAVILNQFPDAKLDEQSEAYIAARFDAAVELAKTTGSSKDGAAQQRKTVHGDAASSSGSNEDKVAKSRKDMITHLECAYKTTKEK
jgi:uncharacterized protein